eukprot:4530779-Prymnesium_polylepis.1
MPGNTEHHASCALAVFAQLTAQHMQSCSRVHHRCTRVVPRVVPNLSSSAQPASSISPMS